MKLLELFAGTGSIGKAFRELGWEVVSVDINPKAGATITADVLAWDYTVFDQGSFDFLWASPPCQQYSMARTTAKTPRNLELADSIVARTLEIIEYLEPKAWLAENPATGLLKTRKVVEGIPWRDVCYCRYSDGERWTYKKQTRLWGHLPTFVPRPLCTRKDPCPLSVGGVHPDRAQRCNRGIGVNHTLDQLYSMPEDLCRDIALAAAEWAQ
jgi:hypothetical protein